MSEKSLKDKTIMIAIEQDQQDYQNYLQVDEIMAKST